jgi:hypothetical protein
LAADSTAIATLPRTSRSRVGNGSSLWLEKVDGRSAEYRRFKDAFGDLILHLGGDQATEPQKYLARRAAALVVWCEKAETALARGEDMNIVTYSTATNSLRRLLADLGLQRHARDVSPPSLSRFIDIPATEPIAASPEAITLDPIAEAPQEPEAADELSLDDPERPAPLPDQQARALDATVVTDDLAGQPLIDLEPVPGQSFSVEGLRATIVYAPRSVDNVGRWAVVDCDGSLKALTMTRSEAERLAAKLKPMKPL